MSRIEAGTLFFDAFTGDAGGGSKEMSGNYNDRIKRVAKFSFSWNLKKANLLFSSSDKTITMQNQYDNRTFSGQDFRDNDEIVIVDSELNDGTYNVSKISDDGKTITVVESLVDESSDGDTVTIHGNTKIRALNLFYNLVPNGTTGDFTSIVDPISKQKFSIEEIDASVTTPKVFYIGTKSWAWVTEEIADEDLGTTNAVYIKGAGISDYVQSFEITQFFIVTPFALSAQQENFEKIIPPSYYYGGRSLKYISLIEGFYNSISPTPDHSIVDEGTNGSGVWLNTGPNGSRGEYLINSISYFDNDTDDEIEKIDLAKKVRVEISVKSRSGKFLNAGSDENPTMFITGFNLFLSNEDDYQDTETTQRDNFCQDSATNFIGSAPVNGKQYGTDRQTITACEIDYVSATEATIIFIVDFGSYILSFLEAKEDDDRRYEITVITQDATIMKTVPNDRMTLLAAFESASWTRKDDTLFAFTSTGIEAFKYPDLGLLARGSIEAFQGEAFYNKIAFKVKQKDGTPDIATILGLEWSVVAIKSGENDFVLERRQIDLSNTKKLKNVQQIEFVDTRNFITYDDDPDNVVSIVRDEANDDSESSAWIAYYGLILRYEAWVEALNQFYSGDTSVPAIGKFIDSLTQDWFEYDTEGWSLVLRFDFSILNTTYGSTNVYRTEIPIEVSKADQVIWDGSVGAEQTTQYFTEDGETELESIDRNGITLIRTTLLGTSPLDTRENYFGAIMATVENGSIYDRRLASTEIPSEDDSPFSAPAATSYVSWSRGNATINIFELKGEVVRITIESYFDSTIYNQTIKAITIQSVVGTYPTES
jgi:hypothetical protein